MDTLTGDDAGQAADGAGGFGEFVDRCLDAGNPQAFVEGQRYGVAGCHQDGVGGDDNEVHRHAAAELVGIGGELDGHTPGAQRFDAAVNQPRRPGDGQRRRNDAQHAHQVHRAVGQVDDDRRAAALGQVLCQLRSTVVIGAQSAADDGGVGVEPHEVSAFEGAAARDTAHNGHTQICEAAGCLAFFAGPDRRCGSPEDGTFGRHDKDIGHKHLIGQWDALRFEFGDGHA